MQLTCRARVLGIWLFAAMVLLGVAHVVLFSNLDAAREQLPAGVWRWFDLNAEHSFGTWFSVGLLLLIGAAAALAAVAAQRPRERLAWWAVAVAATLLSVDDKIQVHERLPEFFMIERQSLSTHEWLVPGVVIAIVGTVALWVLVRSLDRPVRVALGTGLAVLLLGAVVIEGVSGLDARSPGTLPFSLSLPTWVLIEESLEVLGSMIVLVGVVSYLERAAVLHVDCPTEPHAERA